MKDVKIKAKGATFFEIGLPKWPALVVVGKPVTKEQAMEILIRTDSLWISTNDREWDKMINEYLFDITIEGNGGYDSETPAILKKLGISNDSSDNWGKVNEYKDKCLSPLNKLRLSYLSNQRIGSSWIGGPHGWCDWNGNIHSCNYNIGKWPEVKDVYEDWVKIAKAFPFLDLTSQLMSHEAGEESEANPVIQFRIKGGKVTMTIPKKPIAVPSFGTSDMFSRFNNPHAERGCSFEQFKKAIDHTKKVSKF